MFAGVATSGASAETGGSSRRFKTLPLSTQVQRPLKSTRARLKETRKARHDLRKSYGSNQGLEQEAQEQSRKQPCAKRAPLQASSEADEFVAWLLEELDPVGASVLADACWHEKQRQVLYKMRKWRYEFMKFFRRRIRYYNAKVKRQEGTHVTTAAEYSMWYQYYYLYALKRTLFMGRQMKRLKRARRLGTRWLARNPASAARSVVASARFASTNATPVSDGRICLPRDTEYARHA